MDDAVIKPGGPLDPSTCSPTLLKLLKAIETEGHAPRLIPGRTVQKDYMKENVKRLKEIEEKSKQKKSTPVLRPLKPSSQYSQVQPKVYDHIKMPSLVKKPPEKNVLPSPMKNVSIVPSPRSILGTPKSEDNHSSVAITLPKIVSTSTTEVFTEDGRTENHKDLSRCPSSTTYVGRQKSSKVHVPHPLGRVPAYLLERKRMWEEDEKKRLQSQIDASIPPGHTLLSDDERQETLLLLEKNHDELMQRLASLPVRNDTTRLQKYKEELEKQLAKIEEGIKIFSRPKVLIKNDA